MESPIKTHFLPRKRFARPLTAKEPMNRSLINDRNLQLSVRKITPISRKVMKKEVASSPFVIDCENLARAESRRKILIVKCKIENEETSSIMVSDDVIRQCLRETRPKTGKNKCPLAFLALPLPVGGWMGKGNEKEVKTQRTLSGRRSRKTDIMKRQGSVNGGFNRNSQRMFDYNEILNIARWKLGAK